MREREAKKENADKCKSLLRQEDNKANNEMHKESDSQGECINSQGMSCTNDTRLRAMRITGCRA
jgi:hypothetical protein